MLPFTLLCLLQTVLGALAQQTSRQLSLNQVVRFNATSLPNPIFTLPSSSNDLSVSVALCSNGSSLPKFIVSNDTSITQLGLSDVGQPNVFEVVLGEDGFGNWTGQAPEGGLLAVSGAGQVPFEVGVSDQGMQSNSSSPMDKYIVGVHSLLGGTWYSQTPVVCAAWYLTPFTRGRPRKPTTTHLA